MQEENKNKELEKKSSEEEIEDEEEESSDLSSSDDDIFYVEEVSVDMHKDLVINIDQIIYRYKIVKSLAKYTFIAEDLNSNNDKILLKIHDIYYLNQNNNEGHNKLKEEVCIQSMMESKHIVQLLENFVIAGITGLVMEKCKYNLQELLEKQGRFHFKTAINYLKYILISMSDMHKYNISHNSLRLKYILVGENDELIKLSHFSQAVQLQKDQNYQVQKKVTITPESSPEVRSNQQFGIKSDIYSLGIILYQMLYGKYPFENLENNNVLGDLTQQQQTQFDPEQIDFNCNEVQIPNKLEILIKEMLQQDPNKRINWKQLYESIQEISTIEKTYNHINGNTPQQEIIEIDAEIQKLFIQAEQNQYYCLGETQGYGNQKMKKEQEDMEAILKNTKTASIDIWDYDYIQSFTDMNQFQDKVFKELKVPGQYTIQYIPNQTEQRFNSIKKFENEKQYKEEVQKIQSIFQQKNLIQLQVSLTPIISQLDNELKYTFSSGICTLQEFSDKRVESLTKWKTQEIIYLFRTLISTVLGLHDIGYYHSSITSQNIILEYNHKNARLEPKLINLSTLSNNHSQKPELKNPILEAPHKLKNIKTLTFQTKQDRLHQEILDVLTVLIELLIKSYLPKKVTLDSQNDEEREQILLDVYTQQENLIKEACLIPDLSSKYNFYLDQMYTTIFKDILTDQNDSQPFKKQQQQQQEQQQQDEDKQQQQQDSKLPFDRPQPRKSQFSAQSFLQQQGQQQSTEEEKKNNDCCQDGSYDSGFRQLMDMIQQILVPRLYTVKSLKEFLGRKDIFREWEFNKICDIGDRIIDKVLQDKLQEKKSSLEK